MIKALVLGLVGSIAGFMAPVSAAARQPRGFVSNIEKRQMQDLDISSRASLNNRSTASSSTATINNATANGPVNNTPDVFEIPPARNTSAPPATNNTRLNRFSPAANSQNNNEPSDSNSNHLNRFKSANYNENGANQNNTQQPNNNNNAAPFSIQYR